MTVLRLAIRSRYEDMLPFHAGGYSGFKKRGKADLQIGHSV